MASAVEQRLPAQHICPHLQHSCRWNGSPTCRREAQILKAAVVRLVTLLQKTERSCCAERPVETQRDRSAAKENWE